MRPDLRGVCLDEPTLGQDAHHRRLIGRAVRHLAAAGYLCVVATHDLDWATQWCDELLCMQHGRVVQRRLVSQPALGEQELACRAVA
jgi:ABC-type hemin transport system ATPase subunit